MSLHEHQPKWWKESVVYQIYPASYKDSNGDGIGDLPGIISKLDYIKSVGVDVIWVCPFFKSPQYDLGYDIADYKEVHEPYGSVKDVEKLIEGCHARGLKVLFDLVVNHTSHEHAWFKESRSSKTNPKRDWYMWRPARYIDGVRHSPCNWRAAFGGSVWEWDELTEEYYLHYFCPEQPDLNWENPVVREAIYTDAVRFWLDKGVDGFRIDTVNMYSKYLDFPDAPVIAPEDPWQPAPMYFSNGPRLHEFLKEMNKETFAKYDCVTIGELPATPQLDHILSFVAAEAKQLDMAIQFDLADLDHGSGRFGLMRKDWSLLELKEITAKSQAIALPEHGAWATTYLENHDQARSPSRYGSDSAQYRVASSTMLATYLLTLSGTPIIYQGEEIGMINCPKEWDMAEYKDVGTVNQWKEIVAAATEEKNPALLEEGRAGIQLTARDHSRTPMQWDASKQAGFTTSEHPWMRVMDSYLEINVAAQEKDDKSPLAYYRHMLAFRKLQKDLFTYGKYMAYDEKNENTLVYTKTAGDRVALIALNFKGTPQNFDIPTAVNDRAFKLVVRNIGALDEAQSDMLQPYEARIYISE